MVIVNGVGETTRVNCCETVVGDVSVALTVKVELVSVVAVPEIKPVEESEIPAGRDPDVSAKVTAPVALLVWIWKL